MSDDGADKRRKRRSLRVPVDEVPRPTAPPDEPEEPAVVASNEEQEFDGTATVEMPAFIDDDDGLVASWITPSSGTPRTTVASPPPSQEIIIESSEEELPADEDGADESEQAESAPSESDPVALASVEVDLDSGLQAVEDQVADTAVGAESPTSIDEVDAEVAPREQPEAEAEAEETAVAAVPATQVVVQRVVSVAVGEPTPTPPEVQEPEPEFEEPDIIVDDEYDPDGDDFDEDGEYDSDEEELDEDSRQSQETELPSEEMELDDDEPVSQEIIVDDDDDDGPILTSDGDEDDAELDEEELDGEELDEDDDEPSLETAEITEEELAEELPEEDGELEELDALELDEASSPEIEVPANKPPAPPDKQKAPPPPPKTSKPAAPPPAAPAAEKPAPRRKKARKKWFEELFNDDYLRTVPVPHPKTIVRQCDFIEQRFGLAPGATILDVGCGLGLHAVELTRRGYLVVGLDLSLPMLSRAADEAQSEGFKINFLHADMREMNFEGAFDAVLCWNTTLGYFDDDTNKQIIERLYKALKPRGLLLLDVVNRDYVIQGQPNLVWFEGDGAVVMEETKMNYITSRLEVKRTVILDNGRQRDSLYSLRLYSVHELGQLLHHKGFRVVELTGREAHPGVFFGSASPRLIILAERRANTPARPSVSPPAAPAESTPPPKPPEGDAGEPKPSE